MFPSGLTRGLLASIVNDVRQIEGFLTDCEIEFLAVLGACPTAAGCIVELGTLNGRSATALAMGAQLSDRALVHTVDLLPQPACAESARRCHVEAGIRTYTMPSSEFWKDFDEPLRLLWHDGCNDRKCVADDVASCARLLADGAIIAFHDVLNSSGERLHTFVDDVLESPLFGHAGVVGTIGWAQFTSRGCSATHTSRKRSLQRRLSWLKPFHTLPARRPTGLTRVVYETIRLTIPHGAVNLERWYEKVT